LGLYYNRARYLNPDTGRFWSLDKSDGSPEDPLTLHKYLYAESDPLNSIDPTGLSPLGAEVEGQEISGQVDKSVKNTAAKLGKRIIKKVACDIVPGQVVSGVYVIVISEIGGANPYIYIG